MPLSDAANTSEATGSAPEAPASPEAQESARSEIDLKALAEKIYELLKEEARLERERLGRYQTW